MITLSSFYKSHSIYTNNALDPEQTKEAFADAIFAWEKERLIRRHHALVALSEVFEGSRKHATLAFDLVVKIACRILYAFSPVNVDPDDLAYSTELMTKLVEEKISSGEFIDLQGKTKRSRMVKKSHGEILA